MDFDSHDSQVEGLRLFRGGNTDHELYDLLERGDDAELRAEAAWQLMKNDGVYCEYAFAFIIEVLAAGMTFRQIVDPLADEDRNPRHGDWIDARGMTISPSDMLETNPSFFHERLRRYKTLGLEAFRHALRIPSLRLVALQAMVLRQEKQKLELANDFMQELRAILQRDESGAVRGLAGLVLIREEEFSAAAVIAIFDYFSSDSFSSGSTSEAWDEYEDWEDWYEVLQESFVDGNHDRISKLLADADLPISAMRKALLCGPEVGHSILPAISAKRHLASDLAPDLMTFANDCEPEAIFVADTLADIKPEGDQRLATVKWLVEWQIFAGDVHHDVQEMYLESLPDLLHHPLVAFKRDAVPPLRKVLRNPGVEGDAGDALVITVAVLGAIGTDAEDAIPDLEALLAEPAPASRMNDYECEMTFHELVRFCIQKIRS